MSEEDQIKVYKEFLLEYEGKDMHTLKWCQRNAMFIVLDEPHMWRQGLRTISYAYKNGVYFFDEYIFRRNGYEKPIPVDVAEDIVRNPLDYPAILVNMAEQVCSNAIASKMIPVGTIAREQNWFE